IFLCHKLTKYNYIFAEIIYLNAKIMKDFFTNFIGYIAIVAMIFSMIYTWAKVNSELKKMEKAK
ncbi:MAG: hypothetical protein RR770_02275, partial [Bacteroidales bacterium]